MLINTSLSTDSSSSSPLNNRAAGAPAAPSASAPQPSAVESDLGRFQGLDGDSGIPDSAGADQAVGFSRANFLSQPALALAAQANLNPESVFNLLR